jgi:hypothetical protein
MLRETDGLDIALKDRIDENPGACIRQIIQPFLLERSESVLCERIRALELRQMIRLQRTKKEVLCFPEEKIENSLLTPKGEAID